jgi:hypothetical protein
MLEELADAADVGPLADAVSLQSPILVQWNLLSIQEGDEAIPHFSSSRYSL